MPIAPRSVRLLQLIAVVSLATALPTSSARAQEGDKSDEAALARQVRSASVSLARGLSAARARGTPISAKYEMDGGKLQLSVYVARRGAYAEVIVDHRRV